MKDRRIIIVTGGRLGEWAIPIIGPDDYIIGADAGALFLVRHGIRPDIALGDFDSVTAEELDQIRRFSGETHDYDPIDKDYTDTELAWRLAVDKNPREIVMVGALGTRFDHTLANVHLLRLAARANVPACLMDEHNRIRLVTRKLRIADHGFSYISLLPLSETVTGITLSGFQYPLHEATIEIGQSIGISNRLQEHEGLIEIDGGLLLVIESRD
ncbi:thiamine diphosphokinase [Paenibacillus sacheonensis]|uniref:Thiamine diphosphokinase n=1 Tax=Paenibacillus sacheonensis TaxID=742054 RepID=A0A7X4YKN7_9BACL|nr:thiamine diphosphokinase [Paenibacillus sacheonensis]MBM7563349.1 thiamine pyrophosphokinase [Paenibacillus sacheonensis]NBC68095.1 thiamine diphosphokinase [Paenibacillus sacheonensis]